MVRQLTDEEIGRQLGDLPDWTREGDAIVATMTAPDFPAAIALVRDAADEAEQMNHHPDIDIRWRTLRLVLTTHDSGGITRRDVELAARMKAAIDDVRAAARGHEAVIVSHQAPIWTVRCAYEGRRFLHDPRKRECTLASLTSLTWVGDDLLSVSYSEPAASLLALAQPGAGA